MYVITGVTGHTGKVAAEALLALGKQVTVVVRSAEKGEPWKKKGALVAIGNLGDADAMTGILRGAEGAYLLVPPNMSSNNFLADQRKVSDALALAVKASGVAHVVLLSSVGAHLESGTGPILSVHYAESVVGAAAKNITFLRASYFLENWGSSLPTAKEQGVLPSFLTIDRKIPMIATAGIGAAAAEALLNPATGKLVREIEGPQEYSPQDIAKVAGEVLKKPVQAQQAPIEQMAAILIGFGFTPNIAQLMQEMTEGLNSGHVIYEGTDIHRTKVTPQEVFAPMLA